jgi:ABC-type transporter Mla maintaining outer membrane lipid asymmetry ATPase subunit MlaF
MPAQYDGDLSQTALHIEDLTVAYQRKPVLWDVDLDVPSGVLMAIIAQTAPARQRSSRPR